MIFSIDKITNNGVKFDDFDGISIEKQSGVIKIEENNQLPLGLNSIDILIKNDDGETLFENVFQITLTELERPNNLTYADSGIKLLFDQIYVSQEPAISGASNFFYSLPDGFMNEAIIIDSVSGVITINAKFLNSAVYSIPIMVTNTDGQNTFINAFQFEVLGQYYVYDNGYYFMNNSSGELSDRMVSNNVEAGGFGSADRQGLYYTYTYLESSSYVLAKIKDGQIDLKLGGETEFVNDDNHSPSCGLDAYSLIKELVPAETMFEIDTDGLHLILFDSLRSEIIFQPIQKVAMIGSATEEGWSGDTELMESSGNANGAEFRLEKTALRIGEFKFRFNCQWNINRLIDNTQSADDPNNGYILQTSLSADINAGELLLGGKGSNIYMDESKEGFYDILLKWEGGSQFTYQLTRVGDIPTLDFNPSAFEWAVVGEATEVGWPTDNDCGAGGQDIDLTYVGESEGTYYWQIDAINLTAGAFRFRANNCWDVNLGSNNASIAGAASDNFNFQDSNFSCLVAGVYHINLYTENEGLSYVMEVSQ